MDFAFAVDRVRALDYLISALLCGAPPQTWQALSDIKLVRVKKGMKDKDDAIQGLAKELEAARKEANVANKASVVAIAQAKLPPF